MINLKPHNKEAYSKITAQYASGANSVIYVSGVGTGKSYVFMAVADSVPGRILYIVPKHAITNNITSYKEFSSVARKVDFATYNAFMDVETGKNLVRGYDLVVVDECHHLGSDRYGRVLTTVMKEKAARFLGLTATPVRDVDKFDVSAYFDSRVDGLTNFEAISLGLMPPIEYRLCLPERSLRQVEKEYDNTVKAVLTYEGSEEVLAGAVKLFERDKWICFFPSTTTLEAHKQLVERLFPGYKIFTLYASLKNLDTVMDGLRSCDKAVVLSCNILLEGVHMDGIDGIVLFRNVTSLTAFQQMIGRVCSIGKTTSPVVLDCSACALKLMAKLLAQGAGSAPPPGQTHSSNKEIVRIGIGEHRSYDVQRLLMLAQGVVITEKEESAVRKYESFCGKQYADIAELKENKLDYSKLEACCSLFGASFYGAARLITAKASGSAS